MKKRKVDHSVDTPTPNNIFRKIVCLICPSVGIPVRLCLLAGLYFSPTYLGAQLFDDDQQNNERVPLEIEEDGEDISDESQYSPTSSVVSFTANAPPFTVLSPIINSGVELGINGFYAVDPNANKDGWRKQRHQFVSGITDWISLEFETVHEKKPGTNFKLLQYEMASRIKLTETKTSIETPNPLDLGIRLGISVPNTGSGPYEMDSRLLLYKQAGPWRATGNFILENEFGISRSGGVKLAYANQVRYWITPNIQPGIQMFGRLGKLNNLSISREQHKAGPGVFGFFGLNRGIGVKYELSWLFGFSGPTPNHSLKSLLKFEYLY